MIKKEYAFPQEGHSGDVHYHPGLTLRDYFAAQAITGLLAVAQAENTLGGINWAESIATDAYMLADAMMAEREKS